MTKANNPLLELDARWRPIFADPQRDYHYLTAIDSFRRTGAGRAFA